MYFKIYLFLIQVLHIEKNEIYLFLKSEIYPMRVCKYFTTHKHHLLVVKL